MPASAISIALVISTMGPGGAERVVSHLTRHWVREGKRVVLITLSKETSFYELEKGIEVIGLGLMSQSNGSLRGGINNIKRIRTLRKVIRKTDPDVVISFMDKTNVIVLCAALGLGIPVVVSERLFPGSYKLGLHWEYLRKLTYAYAFSVVAVTEAMKQKLQRLGFSRIRVIHNPVVPQTATGGAALNVSEKFVLAAGRMEHQKGFDVLIEAFSLVHARFSDWSLIIVGSGEQETELKETCIRNGVGGKVRFPGTSKELDRYIDKAEVFVLSSRNEGFPNVLLEAMAAGKAVIASDCQSGPSEMITHNVNGILVETGNVASLSHALHEMMDDESMRSRLGHNARDVSVRFSLESVMKEWQQLLDEAIAA